MVATYEDAALVVQLVRWGTEMGLEEATHALFADGFDAKVASIDHPSVRKMLLFGETVGTLVKHGILDKELVQDLWWIDGSWVGSDLQRDASGSVLVSRASTRTLTRWLRMLVHD